MRHIFTTTLILLLAGLFSASQGMAATAIGTVIGVQGAATAMDGGGTRTLEMTSQVYVADTILTGPGSKVQILFNDDTILAQGPESESTLTEYAYLAGDQADSQFMLDMAEGTFRIITGKIVEDNDQGFRMQTPLAVIGIRGTMTGHLVQAGKEHHYSLDLEGKHTVDISTRFDSSYESLTQDFQAVDIIPGVPVPGSRDMTPEEQDFMTDSTSISQYNSPSGSVLAENSDDEYLLEDGFIMPGDDDASKDMNAADMPIKDSMDTGMMEDMQSGGEVTVVDASDGFTPDVVTVAGLFYEVTSPGPPALYDAVEPYQLQVQDVSNTVTVPGVSSNYLEIENDANKLTALVIDTKSASSCLPVTLTYTELGSNSDAQWGYWATGTTLTNSDGRDYELVKIYDVQVDIPNSTRPDLAGSYTGSASGVLYYNNAVYHSTTGTYTCNITDVVSGTITTSIMVDYGSGLVFSGNGNDTVNNGRFNIALDTGTLQIPAASPGMGSADVSGAVGTDGTVAGTYSFSESGVESHGVGEFHATHD